MDRRETFAEIENAKCINEEAVAFPFRQLDCRFYPACLYDAAQREMERDAFTCRKCTKYESEHGAFDQMGCVHRRQG
jgi:hypothetical protein